MSDRYSRDVLADSGRGSAHHRPRPRSVPTPARIGLVVEEVESGTVGEIVRIEKAGGLHTIEVEDRRGRRATFELGPGFWIDGKPVELTYDAALVSADRAARRGDAAAATPPRPGERGAPPVAGRTASGSRAVANARARTARASRILVEGVHDAELIERIWGEDLRIEGIVVEPIGGLDNLADWLVDFAPADHRKVGVLADHLLAGTKEMRIADAVRRDYPAHRVHVVGHPYVDVWAAIRPERVGIRAWPEVPRGTDWKTGVVRALGWPAADHRDLAVAWKRIVGRVSTIADVEATLSGRVEELIDFVTQSGAQ